MKKILLLFFFFSLFGGEGAFAQPGEWTWMSGSSAPNASGVFGTQGVPSINNHPPGLYEVANWKDNQGNFWLYAGIGPGIFVYGDLWMFNPGTLEWTWVNGTSNVGITPVWGIKGVASPTNNPGTRSWGICSWTDQAGDLWFFGGETNIGFVNDLWKYNIASNLWTWMSGDTITNSVGNFGVLGVPSVNNFPPCRSTETATSWTDDNNNLWLFGGTQDDLWRYNVSTNEWTWMNGSMAGGAAAVFGTKGIADPANTPGARPTYTHWKDTNGNFWLFGGNSTNDMWKYDLAVNEWAWMSGTNLFNNAGNYISTCLSDPSTFPSSRFEHKQCWTDACGNFWLIGGSANGGCINDLWRFNPSTLEWTWVNGNTIGSSPSVYGTMGTSSPANVVGGRMGGSGWVDGNNNLWLYGGSTTGYAAFLADMWRFAPDPSCTQCLLTPVALFNAPNHICPGTCTSFNNLSINATSYLWTFAGATPSTSTNVNPTNICYNTPGNYTVSLIASNATGSDTITLNNFITVYPFPPPQGILQNGDTLFANTGAVSYEWYHNGNLIPGATDYFYVADTSGDYNIVATDANNCEVEAVMYDVVAAVQFTVNGLQFTVYPNPVNEKLEIGNWKLEKATTISIYNMLGVLVLDFPTSNIRHLASIDVSALAKGMYWLKINTTEKSIRTKFIKQ